MMSTPQPNTRYKDFRTKRGFNYHYLAAAATSDKSTLFFIHGFPSTSYDWHHQVDYFSTRGYGLIVPDMLGYGGTDKPTDPKDFTMTAMAADLVEILDAEHIDRAFAIGHDWGCVPVSRLAMLHADRFLGFAWLSLGFTEPVPEFPLEAILVAMKKAIGTELYGYWTFFIKDSAAAIIEKNVDSLLDALYPADPELWRSVMNVPGEMEAWVRENKRTERAKYLSEVEYNKIRENLLQGGLTGPLNWYKAMERNLNREDNLRILPENLTIPKPGFFGAALKDYVCFAGAGKDSFADRVKDLTVVEFDTGHWIQLEESGKLNKALESWFERVAAATK